MDNYISKESRGPGLGNGGPQWHDHWYGGPQRHDHGYGGPQGHDWYGGPQRHGHGYAEVIMIDCHAVHWINYI